MSGSHPGRITRHSPGRLGGDPILVVGDEFLPNHGIPDVFVELRIHQGSLRDSRSAIGRFKGGNLKAGIRRWSWAGGFGHVIHGLGCRRHRFSDGLLKAVGTPVAGWRLRQGARIRLSTLNPRQVTCCDGDDR